MRNAWYTKLISRADHTSRFDLKHFYSEAHRRLLVSEPFSSLWKLMSNCSIRTFFAGARCFGKRNDALRVDHRCTMLAGNAQRSVKLLSRRGTERIRSVRVPPRKVRRFGFIIAITMLLQASFSLLRGSPKGAETLEYSDKWFYQNIFQLPAGCNITCQQGWNNFEGACFEVSPRSVSLVISFCSHELGWLIDALVNIQILDITIYSKCGLEEVAKRFLSVLPYNASVVTLPNVGRVDHTFAFHMASLAPDTDPDTVVLYIKDTFEVIHQRGMAAVQFSQMVSAAAGPLGFGCGLRPRGDFEPTVCKFSIWKTALLHIGFDPEKCKVFQHSKDIERSISPWHLTRKLEKFTLKTYYSKATKYQKVDCADFSNGETFAEWLRAMHISLPSPVTMVCYGGNFAVKVANILNSRRPILNMLHSLSRGDNIVQGHYAERTWAGLLSSRPSMQLTEKILRSHLGSLPFSDMIGCLYGCIRS